MNRHMKGIIGTVIAIGASLALAAPANAQPPGAWPCDPDNFCIYHDANGGGSHWYLNDGASDLGILPGANLNDHVYSVRNLDGGYAWCLYSEPGFEGFLQYIPANWAGNLSPDIANRVTSVNAEGIFGC